jgi:hypothetical protein
VGALEGGVMDDPFSRMQDPAKRAERYGKMAEEL